MINGWNGQQLHHKSGWPQNLRPILKLCEEKESLQNVFLVPGGLLGCDWELLGGEGEGCCELRTATCLVAGWRVGS